MRSFYRLIALVLMVLWVPLTSHCYLEEAGLLKLNLGECCSDDGHSTPAKSDPCDSGCKLVEKAGFKSHYHQKLVIPVVSLFHSPVVPRPQLTVVPIQITLWPPKTLHLAQFVAQTATPPRAPSIIS